MAMQTLTFMSSEREEIGRLRAALKEVQDHLHFAMNTVNAQRATHICDAYDVTTAALTAGKCDG